MVYSVFKDDFDTTVPVPEPSTQSWKAIPSPTVKSTVSNTNIPYVEEFDPCDLNSCNPGAICVPGGPDEFNCVCSAGLSELDIFDDGRIIVCTQKSLKSDLAPLFEKTGSKLDSISDEPSTGFKDCGKRSSQRDTTLSFSNGGVISAQQVNSKLHSTIKAIHLRDIAKCLGEA